MGLEGIPIKQGSQEAPDAGERIPELKEVLSALQRKLAVVEHSISHPESPVNMDHLDEVDPQTRNEIMMSFIKSGSASAFRGFYEDPIHPEHAHERIDLNDPVALTEFLTRLKPYKDDAMH